MKQDTRQKIVIIGCGNLAWHLAKHFSEQKKFTLFVYNHKPNKNLEAFKKQLGCEVTANLENIISSASFYFICVADKYISSTSKKIKSVNPSSLVIHASGSVSIDEISRPNSAVFYPLQTFTKEDEIKWGEIPILIETNKKEDFSKLKKLAGLFSEKIIQANSYERAHMHLAAVLVNNFTNALYTAANNYLSGHVKNKALTFNLLLPLIEQTAVKLKRVSPAKAQTGPAKRDDKRVMKAHLHLLKKEKDLKKLYKQLSLLIAGQQNHSHAQL